MPSRPGEGSDDQNSTNQEKRLAKAAAGFG
jgi:hypothetical protein